jgi:hypothetical protein
MIATRVISEKKAPVGQLTYRHVYNPTYGRHYQVGLFIAPGVWVMYEEHLHRAFDTAKQAKEEIARLSR